ncbi:lysosome-associated membrane glycoprotein 5 isoform X2 [Megalopta genalis]|uniref:lysosome-associated membrane glycoprotein 5 isoform X2 n=1 Tax=Megalopta genalis TaxID=115081 RepID=UPI003FD2F1D5
MLKAPTIDRPAPEFPRSAHKFRERRLDRTVLRATAATRRTFFKSSSVPRGLRSREASQREDTMARRVDYTKAVFVLWCVSTSAISLPSPSPLPQKLEDQLYTTRRTPKLTFDLPGSKSKQASLRSTTTILLESTTVSIHKSFGSEQPLYRLDRSNGQACILLQVDALITVKYRTNLGEDGEASIYVPNDATVTGNCNDENTVTMSLKWKAFVLLWSFAKTPGGERWYVEKIELTYNSSDRHFEHIDQPNKTVRLSTGQKHSSMLFPTPVGKSYACSGETEIPLTDGKNHASVLLRDMKLQPFKYKNNEFAAEFSCTALSARGFRDETAPVAVGSTLAAAVLLTITGYAGYRYFKVKKVKYDTME